jgi:hypothetical protein
MTHLVRDEGVAGSNPATPTTIFDGVAWPPRDLSGFQERNRTAIRQPS